MEGYINFLTSVWKKEVNGNVVKLLVLILLAAVLILEMAANPLALMPVKESIQSGIEMPGEESDYDAYVGIMDVEIPTGTALGKYFEVGGKIGSLKEMIPKGEFSDAISLGGVEAAVPGIAEPSLPNSVASDIIEPDLSDLVIPDMAESDFIMPDTISQDSVTAEPSVPDLVIQGSEITEPSVPDLVNQGSEITEPVTPDIEDVVITNPEITIPAVPDTGVLDSADSENGDAGSAFLIDEAGMLYGFMPEKAEIVDGILELPMEGCIGIRKGVFDGYGENIVELYIPSNISVIEEGAFIGLDSLEWIEAADGNAGCTSVDGVLFDSSLTVLLTFPNGRTGAYIVPASVTRIADGAFANTSLSVLDMRDCENVVMENGVFGDFSGEGIEILMPRGEVVE